MKEQPSKPATEKSTSEKSTSEKSTRRGFVKKLSYAAPFILSLKVAPAHATNGSGGGGHGDNSCPPRRYHKRHHGLGRAHAKWHRWFK